MVLAVTIVVTMWCVTMSSTGRIKGTLGGDGSTEPGFNYHCRECDEEFETDESSRSNVECPNCGAMGTRAITKL